MQHKPLIGKEKKLVCNEMGITLFELFADPLMLGEVCTELSNATCIIVRSLLVTLWRERDFLKIGVEVRLKELSEIIKESAPKNDAEIHQTPIIPSRIYCAILASLLGSLDDIERDLDTLLDAYRKERTVTITAPEGLTKDQFNQRRKKELKLDLRIFSSHVPVLARHRL
jgi:hypothetical protein